MKHEQEAMERQNLRFRVNELEAALKDMGADFAQCARGISPCFFCANDENCNCSDDKDCNFVWQPHN